MFLQSAYLTELLSEANMVFAQEDFGNKLSDVLTPMKKVFLEDKQILPYSLSRYCGGDSRIGFYVQWFYYNYLFSHDSTILYTQNLEYLSKRIHDKFSQQPGVQKIIEKQINEFFIPRQLQIFRAKSAELVADIVYKSPYMSKYLSGQYTSQFLASDIQLQRLLYSGDIPLNSVLDAQSTRTGFALIGYPILVSFYFAFNQPDNPINARAIQWGSIEELLKEISFLYQAECDDSLMGFIHCAGLSEKSVVEWLNATDDYKRMTSKDNRDARDMVARIKAKVHTKCLSDLDNIIFPDKFKTMLNDLIEWAYQYNTEEMALA